MRIIGGEFSGRRIEAPKGRVARPTTDRTREAIYNILAHRRDFSFDGIRILDLFAGSGALGLEALSRGASFCLFVEIDAGARGAIRGNIDQLGLFGRTRVHRRSAIALGPKPSGVGAPFDLAFLDPPYGQSLIELALPVLRDGGWLRPAALLVTEQGIDDQPAVCEGFTVEDTRTYGDTAISFLAFSAG